MLYAIAICFILLWLLGVVSAYTVNGLIYLLLVAAVILILIRVVTGEKQ